MSENVDRNRGKEDIEEKQVGFTKGKGIRDDMDDMDLLRIIGEQLIDKG